MTKSKNALSASIVLEFCGLCNWAHEVWLNHLELFDNNPRATELMKSFAKEELERLSKISHEYSLLQIAKLDDRAVMSGKTTLGIDYVVTFGDWSDSVRDSLKELQKKLNGFASQLKGVRNKSLTHNDLAAIAAGATLGEFAKGADEEYFKTLEEFVNKVHENVVGGPWQYDKFVINDVAAFLDMVKPR